MTKKATAEDLAAVFKQTETRRRTTLEEVEAGEAPAMCWRQVVRRMNAEKPYLTDRDPGDEREEEELISCR